MLSTLQGPGTIHQSLQSVLSYTTESARLRLSHVARPLLLWDEDGDTLLSHNQILTFQLESALCNRLSSLIIGLRFFPPWQASSMFLPDCLLTTLIKVYWRSCLNPIPSSKPWVGSHCLLRMVRTLILDPWHLTPLTWGQPAQPRLDSAVSSPLVPPSLG